MRFRVLYFSQSITVVLRLTSRNWWKYFGKNKNKKQREEKEWKESLFMFLSWQLLVSSLTISIQSSELDWENHIVALFVGILFRGSNSSRDHEWFELLVNLFSRFFFKLLSVGWQKLAPLLFKMAAKKKLKNIEQFIW